MKASPLESNRVIVEAPLSFTGSAKRIWRLSDNVWLRWLVLLPLIILAWCFVLAWYAIFGILLVPYRLIRRSQRKQRLERLRHEEMLGAIAKRVEA